MAKEWRTIKQFFSDDSEEKYSAIAGLANVQELMSVFKAALMLTAQMVKNVSMVQPPSPTAPPGQSCSKSNNSNNNNNNSNNSNSCSNSNSSGSIRHLSANQVVLMQSLFKVNFDQFQGDEWLLPSGAIFDHALFEATKDAQYECPLHSFVIENSADVLGLFPDARDQEEIKKELVGRTNEKLPALSSAEKALLEIYNKDPEELETLFAEKGWCAVGASLAEKPSADFQRLVYECLQQLLRVYRGVRMTLPQAPHEAWVTNRLWGFLADA